MEVGKIVQLTGGLRNMERGGRSSFAVVSPKSWVDMVREFHEKYGATTNTKPTHIEQHQLDLNAELLYEEQHELITAMDAGDLVEIADGLADLAYILISVALTYGIPLDEVFAEVHRSNMTKDGSRREDGKICKGESFEPPRIKEILDKTRLDVTRPDLT